MIETIKTFKRAGEPTDCTPIDFVRAIRERLPVLQLTSPEAVQERHSKQFESYDRYEYRVIEDGETLAIMVIVHDVDVASGKDIINSLHTASIRPNLLAPAYRWMKGIAKKMGIDYIVLSRFKNGGYGTESKLIKINNMEPDTSTL